MSEAPRKYRRLQELSAEEVERITTRYRAGEKIATMAREHGVCHATLRNFLIKRNVHHAVSHTKSTIKDPVERFFSYVDKSGECWVWTRCKTPHGYGHYNALFNTIQGETATHRIAYILLVGPIPDGLVLDHKCRNRACCNPSHLRCVTHKINITENSLGSSARKIHNKRHTAPVDSCLFCKEKVQ